MLSSQFLQQLKIFQYRNHKISILFRIFNEHKMIYMFLFAVNFAMYIVTEGNFSFLSMYVSIAFCTVFMLSQYRVCLKMYDGLKESAYRLAEEEREKIAQFDKEDYIKWATMESYILYEKKIQDRFNEKYKTLNEIVSFGILAVIVLTIVIVISHLVK